MGWCEQYMHFSGRERGDAQTFGLGVFGVVEAAAGRQLVSHQALDAVLAFVELFGAIHQHLAHQALGAPLALESIDTPGSAVGFSCS